MPDKANESMIYVGTYTNGTSEGIYSVNLDNRTGRLEVARLEAKLENPSYLALSGDGKFLYAVLEIESYEGNTGGAVAALRTGNRQGSLELLNIQPTIGRWPCHLTVDSYNHYLYTANYKDGSISIFPLEYDGHIRPVLSHIFHHGKGPDRERQEQAHAHCVILASDEKFLCAADLGTDQLVVYETNLPDKGISTERSRTTHIKPGSGPRHIVFHPDGRQAYLLNELSSEIAVLHFSANTGYLDPVQYISTLPENCSSESYGAAVHVSPNGKFLYASNRGHDSIAIFRIHPDTGMLEICSYQPTLGSYPRDFALNPEGTFLVAANQYSGTLVSFHVDEATGIPEPTGYAVELADAFCLKFFTLEIRL